MVEMEDNVHLHYPEMDILEAEVYPNLLLKAVEDGHNCHLEEVGVYPNPLLKVVGDDHNCHLEEAVVVV